MTPDDTPHAMKSHREADHAPVSSPDQGQPLRVLQVMASMNRGGAESFIMSLYRKINRDQVQFDFVVHTDDEGDFDSEIKRLGGKIFHAPRYRGTNHRDYSAWWRHFLRLHPEYRVIHGHVRSVACIYLRIAQRRGLTTISHSHSTTSGSGPEAWAKAILQWPIKYIADYLFAPSSDAARWLFGKRGAARTGIIRNAIDVQDFAFNPRLRRDTRLTLGLDAEFVIGHVARFHPVKNHEFLVDVASELAQRGENVVLLLVGDGELRRAVERKVVDLNLDRHVRFLGVRTDIAQLMQAMDCMLLPSFREGFPVALVEAQAAGLPCVVSDSITRETAITDLVTFLALDAGASAWADWLISNRPPYARYDTAAKITAAGFDSRQVAEQMASFYMAITQPSEIEQTA